jgi:hypothetical protein
MSDTLFVFLVVGALYATVRAEAQSRPSWLVVASITLGLATTIRTVGVFVVLVLAVVGLLGSHTRRDRVLGVGAGTGVALAVTVVYLLVQWSATGVFGLTPADGYNLYARAAPFADCSRFDPPKGTQGLCERVPPARRPGGIFYEWEPLSPAGRLFGIKPGGQLLGGKPPGSSQLAAFSRAAIIHQPGDYLTAVGRDLYRYFDPAAFHRAGTGGGPTDVIAYLHSDKESRVLPAVASYWDSPGVYRHDVAGLYDYGTTVEVPGLGLLALLTLGVAAPLLARGAARRAALMSSASAVVLLVVPVATLNYDGRYALPAYPLLGAGAALALQALWERYRARDLARSDLLRAQRVT